MSNTTSKPDKTRAKVQAFEDDLAHFEKACKLDAWNAFVNEMTMSGDLFLALNTGRPELIKLVKPRALTAEEAAPLFQVIATLIETNMALREHAEMTARLVHNWGDAFKHLRSLGDKVQRFANFEPTDDDRGDSYA